MFQEPPNSKDAHIQQSNVKNSWCENVQSSILKIIKSSNTYFNSLRVYMRFTLCQIILACSTSCFKFKLCIFHKFSIVYWRCLKVIGYYSYFFLIRKEFSSIGRLQVYETERKTPALLTYSEEISNIPLQLS